MNEISLKHKMSDYDAENLELLIKVWALKSSIGEK